MGRQCIGRPRTRLILFVPVLFLAVLPVHAQEIIDRRSGQLFLSVTDLAVQAGPVTLEVRRALHNAGRDPGLLGKRWRLNWESRLIQAGPLILIEEATGEASFKQDGARGEYKSAVGDHLVFEKSGRAIRTKPDLTKETFDSRGRLVERDYRNGNRAILHYDSAGRLVKIDGPRGSSLRITTDKAGRLTQVAASTTAAVRYGYQGGELAEVQRPPASPTRYTYFADGRLSRIEEPLTGVVQFAYDFKGRVMSRRWADGSKERYEYDDKANRLRYTDAGGAVTTIQWSPDGRRQEVTDPLGRKSVLEYDEAGRPLSVTGPAGGTSRISYDGLGRTVAVVDPAGQQSRFEYVGGGSRLRRVQQPGGAEQVYEYDAKWNLTSIKAGAIVAATLTYHPDGSLATIEAQGQPKRLFTYHPDGRLKSTANAQGDATHFEYDRRGNLIREVNPVGGITVRQYDAGDRLISLTDPVGGITRYEYNAKGQLSRLTDAGGAATRFEYDARGRRAADVNSKGQITRYEYDRAGRLTRLTEPGNRASTFRYDPLGNLVTEIDPKGRTVRFEYDPAGRLQKERRPTGLEVSYRYDGLGNLLRVEDNTGAKSELRRDASGLLTSIVDPVGAVTHYQYDLLGNIVGLTDPAGHPTRYTYAQVGALAGVQLPSGDEARYEYDAAGRLVGVRRPGGGITRFSYDAMGNVTALSDPIGNIRRQSYDLAGRLMSATDSEGRVSRYVYDRSGRLTQRQLPDGRNVTYEYDALGNRLKADDGAFPVLFRYDQGGRLTLAEYPAIKKSIRYAYDSSGLKTKLIDAERREVRYEYNDKKQLSAIVLPDGKRMTLAYDLRDRLSGIRYPNGMSGRWEYDAAGRVVTISHRDREGKAAAGFTYRYDQVGNPVERRDSQGGATRFQYDSAGQLVEEVGPAGTTRYRYLPGGSRAAVEERGTVTQYRYDADDRIVQAGAERFSFDKNGNLIGRNGAGGVTRYEYDAEDRLIKVAGPGGVITSYGYAPTGERVWRRDQAGLSYFIYDGLDLIQELGEGGGVKTTYIHGPGVDQPLAMIRDGKTYYYHGDRLGSVTHLTDEEGRVVAGYEYDPFGRIIRHEGTVVNPFTFTGREFDSSTGLYYYRARYYDATLGRFLTKDPAPRRIDEPLDLNPYLYARNNPVRFVDPLGLEIFGGDWVNLPETAEVVASKLESLERLVRQLEHPSNEAWAQNLETPYVDRWGHQDPGWPNMAKQYRENVASKLAEARAEQARLRALQPPRPTAEAPPETAPPGPTRRIAVRPRDTVAKPRPGSPGEEVLTPQGSRVLGVKPETLSRVVIGTTAALQLASCLQLGKSLEDCAIETGIGLAAGLLIAKAASAAGLSVPLLLAAGGYGWVQVTGEGAQQVKDFLDRREAFAAQEAQQRKNLENMEQIITGLEAKADQEVGALRTRLNAALARAQNAAQAAEQAGTNASNLLSQLRGLAEAVANSSAACKDVERLMAEVASRSANVKRYAELVEKGIEEGWTKVTTCQSTDEIDKALRLAGAARPLAQGVAQNYRDAEEAMAMLRQIKAQSEQAKRSLGSGQGILAQVREAANSASDHLNETRNQADLARGAFEEMAPLKAALLNRVDTLRGSFPSDAAQVGQRLAPLVDRLRAKEYAPAFGRFIVQAERGRNRAHESLGLANELLAKPAPLCDGISLPEGQLGEAAGAMANMRARGLGEEIEARAKSCLARLKRPPVTADDGGQTPPPGRGVLTRFRVFCSPSKIKVGQSASCRAAAEYSAKSDVFIDVTGAAAWSTGPTIIGDWPGPLRVSARYEGVTGVALVTVDEDMKKGPTDDGGKRPPDIKDVTEAGDRFRERTPGGSSPGPTSGAAGDGQPIEQPGLKPQPGGGPPAVGAGGPAGAGPGQGVWCYFEQSPGMTLQYWQPEGPCPPMGHAPADPRIPWQGLVPPTDKPPMGGKAPMGGKPPMGGMPPIGGKPPMGSKPTCGPATSCRCASGAIGHIPCDKSKGPCHCGSS